MDVNESDKVEEDRKVRAYLRERFLRFISQLNGKECTVKMYENTEVTCRSKAFDPSFESVIVEDLQTPRPPPLEQAILRTSDIISIHYKL